MTKKRKKQGRRTPSRKQIHITQRDMRILRHVARFRMTTQESLHVQFFEGKDRDAVKSTLRRLCGPTRNRSHGSARYLCSEQLDDRRTYYRLTVRATRLLGVSKDLARPLGIQARIRRYAVLWFLCIEPSAARVPLSLRDYPDNFALDGERLSRAHFYIEEQTGGETRLGFTVVDHGRHRLRIFRNAAAAMRRFLARGWIDEYITSHCFDLTVLTLTETAQRGIELGLEDYLRRVLVADLDRFVARTGETLPFSLRTLVVPGLVNVIPDATFNQG